MPDTLKSLRTGVQRTIEIVQGLRQFTRLGSTKKSSANINDILDSTLEIMKGIYKGKVFIRKNFRELPQCACFPGKLQQVFMNILSNAIDAFEGNTTSKKPTITIRTMHEDNIISVHIKDNGPGIPDEIINKIFDPFYTTKEVGRGTGLGLSVSLGIIEEHRGKIEVQSRTGKGTTFIIKVPLH